jgi:cobalt-zinc-cadmium efflux system outer membrane protein
MLFAVVAAGARIESRPLSPEHIISNFESRTIDNPKLKEFLETNLNRKFFNWPVSSWDFSLLTPAARYYHPELDVAGVKHISSNTK